MQSLTVLFLVPEQVTVKVDVESLAAPERTSMLPYDPDALVTVQLCASAGELAMPATRKPTTRRVCVVRNGACLLISAFDCYRGPPAVIVPNRWKRSYRPGHRRFAPRPRPLH